MSGLGADEMLLDLFREEVRSHAQVLTDGLVALEQAPGDVRRLEALMRAAHSIKGAARVVGVQPAVELAHAMEEILVRAQKGQAAPTAPVVDVLLRGVDSLRAIAQAVGPELDAWMGARHAEISCLLEQLRGVVSPAAMTAPPGGSASGEGRLNPHVAPPPAPPPPAPPPPAPPPPAPASSVEQAVPAEAMMDGPVESEPHAPAPLYQAEEGVVRVAARSLTRLMGLAGESLVQARWLQPFCQSLQSLKRRQMQLAETLEGLRSVLPAGETSLPLHSLLAEADQSLADCLRLLGERIDEFEDRIRNTDDLTSRLYREVISSRMRPFRDGTQGLPRLVRDLARQLGKKVRLEVDGETTEVDRDILEKLDAPLNHLVRNALDHGMESPAERQQSGKPETGVVRIEAAHRGGMLSIVIADDGRGIDLERLRRKVVSAGHVREELAAQLSAAELLEFLFLPGFTTSAAVTEISGRGVGLDVVRSMVHAVGGRVRIHTRAGQGTTFQLELPVTLSVIRAVIVEVAGEPYAFPHHSIDRVLCIPRDALHSLEHHQYLEADGRNVGTVLARQVFQVEGPEPAGEDLAVVLFGEGEQEYGLIVDRLLGEHDLVVRPLDRRLGKVPDIHAAAILDNGSPVLIADVDDLRRSIAKLLQRGRLQRAGGHDAPVDERPQKRILVVDDSITVREVERQLLTNRGYLVETAVDGMEGWNLLRERRFDLVVSDVDMPRLGGIELVSRIKSDPRLQSIPVVIVSYKDREEDRLKGLEAGANYYLTKSSFHDDTLVRAVQELIGEAGG